MDVKSDFSLQEFNTLAVPAIAERFVICQTLEELKSVIALAQEEAQRWRILGGGSNVVLGDLLAGYTIKLELLGKTRVSEAHDEVLIDVGAGESWHKLVEYCVLHGWQGIENLALIPGSVGAAPIQNIGAYGVEVCQFIDKVTALNSETMKVETLDNTQCQFAYRDSLFKKRQGKKYIVLSIRLRLHKKTKLQLAYPALQEALIDTPKPTARDVFSKVIEIRKSKLPDVVETPNAGSFFKNPVISQEKYAILKSRYPEMPAFEQSDRSYKIPAAWLIEKSGWKGKGFEGVKVHEKHALVLTNPCRKPGSAILALAEKIKADVANNFDISLEQEPQNFY